MLDNRADGLLAVAAEAPRGAKAKPSTHSLDLTPQFRLPAIRRDRELTEQVEGRDYAELEELFAHLPARERTRLTALARAVTRAR